MQFLRKDFFVTFKLGKHTDTLIQQLKTKQQETLESKLNMQMHKLSLSLPLLYLANEKRLIAELSFGAK